MKYNPITRRMFLQGAGATLSIPFLQSLLPRQAWGATAQPTKRFISLISTYDYGHHQNFFPTLNVPANVLSAAGHHSMGYAKLSSYMLDGRPSLSRMIGSELTPYLDYMSIFRGLDVPAYTGHGTSQLLGNLGTVQATDQGTPFHALAALPTIDQIWAKHNGKSESLILGAGGVRASFGWDSGNNIVRKATIGSGVVDQYNRIFSNGTFPESTDPVTNAPHPRLDILSRVLEDYNKIKNGRQISSVDKIVLENALDKISDLQNGLALDASQVVASCHHKFVDLTPANAHLSDFRSVQGMKNWVDLITAVTLCNMNPSIVFNAPIVEAFDKHPTEDFHQGHSHKPNDVVVGQVNHEYMGDIHGYFMRNFYKPLLQALSSAVDPANDKSILYNSIVHYGIEHGLVHNNISLPTMLAGNAGGALRSGNYIDYTNRANPPTDNEGGFNATPGSPLFSHNYRGIHYNRILVTILQALGMTRAQYENPAINAYYKNRSDSYIGAHNNGITDLGGYGYLSVPDVSLEPGWSGTRDRLTKMNLHHFKDPVPLPTT